MAAAVVAAAGRVCAFGVVRAAWRGAEVGVGRPAPRGGVNVCAPLGGRAAGRGAAEEPARGRCGSGCPCGCVGGARLFSQIFVINPVGLALQLEAFAGWLAVRRCVIPL